MASTTYKVTASALNLRQKASSTSSSKILAVMSKGTQITSDSQSGGWAHVTYKGIKGYASLQYLSKVSSSSTPAKNPVGSTTPPMEGRVDQTGALTESQYDIYKDKYDIASVKAQMQKYLRAFGCPPKLNSMVDLQYDNTSDPLAPKIGRRMAETMFLHPSILSIAPGKVSYLPGFTSKQKDDFLNRVKAIGKGVDLGDTGGGLSGKLYEFKSAYRDYINTVNLLCRATAVYLGIGDMNMPGSTVKLKNFDYGYWTTPEAKVSGKSSIFDETKKTLSSIVSDNSYIHFFAMHQGTSLNESIDTSTTQSDLETTFNNSNIHSLSRNLEFLFGGTIGGSTFEKDVDKIIDSAGSSSDFIKQFGKLAKNYLSGGRLVFPQMIDNVGYSKTLTATMKFISLYGNKLSIFLQCYVPSLHLLAFTLPKQLSDNMYTYPYLVRAFQQGVCNFDLAVISSLRLNKGGSDNTSWTIDGLPTEIEVSFDITPLYTSLMSSSTTQPFMFLQNTSLAEYLATMCGVDMKANNLWTKLDMAKMALTGKITDVPTNLARGIIDSKLVNGLRTFAQIVN